MIRLTLMASKGEARVMHRFQNVRSEIEFCLGLSFGAWLLIGYTKSCYQLVIRVLDSVKM